MKNGLIIGTIACMVAVILVGSVLAPVINTTTTTTIKVDNDGAVGLRMEKITTGNFTITFDEVDGEFTATNGSDAQIIDDVCIFYADNNVAVWLDDSSVRMVGVDADNKTFSAALSDSAAITITKSSEGVNITDGTVDKTFPVPSWSFVPKSTGAYGFFLNETEVNTAGMDTLFVGSFAGVDCYNGINTYDLPIVLDKTASGSTLSGAKWIKATAEPEELNPDDLHIIPLVPGVVTPDPEPDGIMTLTTPTYTDGDWGYDLTSVDGVQKAVIVSYTGTGSEIVIPAKVGGYDVVEIGKEGYNIVENTSLSSNTTLKIEGSPTRINGRAFNACTNLTGSLDIPSSVTYIGESAFYTCKFTGTLIIPEGVPEIGAHAFRENRFDTIICLSPTISYGNYAFGYMPAGSNLITFSDSVTLKTSSFAKNSSNPGIDKILNLGTYGWTTTTSGMAASEISDNVPALGYLAVAQYNETVRNEGPMAAMFAVIPLIMVIAILMFAVGFAIYRKME
jgi:hypothetical protein